MKVHHHRLCEDAGTEIPSRHSPNIGGEIVPQLLVIHFTAGSTAEGAIDWLCNRASKVSAHIVIGRDGTVTQLVPFNRRANHAGRSQWNGRAWCNNFSIGIELDNAGRLTRKGGKWISSFGKTYPDEEVLEATHRDESQPADWHRFPPAQIRAARETAVAIVRDLGIATIVGHEDISPRRKNDPGPAFPMEAFSREVLAQAELREPEVRPAAGIDHVVTSETPLRQSPNSRARKVGRKPLPKGTLVRPIPRDWWLVELVRTDGGKPVKGWIRVADLLRTPDAEGLSPISPLDTGASPPPDDEARAARRLQICAQIVKFEARRDPRGRIKVYHLPSVDGGGSYEVAGINQRYHPDEAARLRELIGAGRHQDAEDLACEYIASYTDVVSRWTSVPAIESCLRDCAFNRGPTGAAKILQIALKTKADGRIGPVTIEALRKAEEDPVKLLKALREARQAYELQVAGHRPALWKGLVNRWDHALDFSRSLA